jgi:hypothetical protein
VAVRAGARQPGPPLYQPGQQFRPLREDEFAEQPDANGFQAGISLAPAQAHIAEGQGRVKGHLHPAQVACFAC